MLMRSRWTCAGLPCDAAAAEPASRLPMLRARPQFTATLAGAALRRPRAATATTEQLWLMRLIGLLDASAYTVRALQDSRRVPRLASSATLHLPRRPHPLHTLLHASAAYCLLQVYCLGFAAVGATLANLVLAGVGQVLTAAFTRFLLRKHLTNGQLAGIGCVFLGLAVRAAPAAYFNGSPAGGAGDAKAAAAGGLALALRREQAVGAAWVALAALLYSLLVRAGSGHGWPPVGVGGVGGLGWLCSCCRCLAVLKKGHAREGNLTWPTQPTHHQPILPPTPLLLAPGRGVRAAAQGGRAAADQRRDTVEHIHPGWVRRACGVSGVRAWVLSCGGRARD